MSKRIKPPLDPLAQSFCELMESMGYKFVEAKVVKTKKKKVTNAKFKDLIR